MINLIIVAAFSIFGGDESRARSGVSLVASVGKPGSASSAFGTALWALGQLGPAPDRHIAIKIVETPRSVDRLALLHAGRFDLAIVDDDVPTDLADRVRAIMALWPKGRVTVDTEPMQLLVHADVPEDVVYRITGMIFDNADFFPIAHPLIGVGSARDAIVGLDVPVHTGAHKYYQRESPNPKRLSRPIVVVPTDVPTTSGQELETELPSIADDDPYLIQQLAAVCRDLANRGALVHFRDHRLLSDCKKMGAIDLGQGRRRPTM